MPDEHTESVAKSQLHAVQRRLNADDLRDKVEYDSHRRLVDSALLSSNGATDKLGAMAETQGQLVAFIVQQSQREPARLAEAFAHAHVCLFRKDEHGVFLDPPWDAAIEAALKRYAAADTAEESESSAEITLPLIGKIFTGKGKAAVVFMSFLGVTVALSLVIGGLLYWQSSRFADLVDRKFEAASVERASNNRQAVDRSNDIRSDIEADSRN